MVNPKIRETAISLCAARYLADRSHGQHSPDPCPSCRAAVVSLVDGGGQEKPLSEEAEAELSDRIQRAKQYVRNPAWENADAYDFAEAILDLARDRDELMRRRIADASPAPQQTPVAWRLRSHIGCGEAVSYFATREEASASGRGEYRVDALYASPAPQRETPRVSQEAVAWKGERGNWIAPFHSCLRCGVSLNWREGETVIWEKPYIAAQCEKCRCSFSFELAERQSASPVPVAETHPDSVRRPENNHA
jgi:hypothetical protein